ncbi:MAG: hypothetical protein IKE65_04300 [Clostridia bacterium]|nr:hypothetical protein [Clostridia bacterium]
MSKYSDFRADASTKLNNSKNKRSTNSSDTTASNPWIWSFSNNSDYYVIMNVDSEEGTSYYYRMRTVNSVNGKNYYSAWSNVASAKAI